MINTDFLIVTYFVGLFVDWVFQFQWQATNKSKWGKNDNKLLSLAALLSHSAIYGVITSAVVSYIIKLSAIQFNNMLLVLTISHAIIDTRILVKAIMRFKGMTDEQINDTVNYGFMHIGIDHRLHELVIFILAIILFI